MRAKQFDIVDVWWIKDQRRVAIVGSVERYSFTCMCVTTGEQRKLKHDKLIEVRSIKLKDVLKL